MEHLPVEGSRRCVASIFHPSQFPSTVVVQQIESLPGVLFKLQDK